MTTRTMRLASGFLDSLSASETAARSTFADRSRRSCIHLFVLVLQEDRLGIPRICAHRLAQTCADIIHVARFRDKIYLPFFFFLKFFFSSFT